MKKQMPCGNRISGTKFAATISILALLWAGCLSILSLYMIYSRGTAAPTPGNPTPTDIGDIATVLFGASSLALIILSLLAAGAAIFGYQALKASIKEEIVSKIELEIKGRLASGLGHTLGFLSTKPTQWGPTNREQLEEAVLQCQKGFDCLQDLSEQARVQALNNLVYYASTLGQESRSGFLLEGARELRDHGQRRNVSHLLLTYCRVAILHGDDSDKEEARKIAKSLVGSGIAGSPLEEAQFYLRSLGGAGGRKGGSGGR